MIRVLLLVIFTSLALGASAQQLNISANVSESNCSGTLHTVSIKVSGGQAPYTYQWSDGGTTAFRNDLKGGQYTCTVTDGKGLNSVYQTRLSDIPEAISIEIIEVEEGNSTILKAQAKGGQAPYTYLWIGKGLNSGQYTQPILRNYTAGNYQVVVQDANGCPAIQNKIINN